MQGYLLFAQNIFTKKFVTDFVSECKAIALLFAQNIFTKKFTDFVSKCKAIALLVAQNIFARNLLILYQNAGYRITFCPKYIHKEIY